MQYWPISSIPHHESLLLVLLLVLLLLLSMLLSLQYCTPPAIPACTHREAVSAKEEVARALCGGQLSSHGGVMMVDVVSLVYLATFQW